MLLNALYPLPQLRQTHLSQHTQFRLVQIGLGWFHLHPMARAGLEKPRRLGQVAQALRIAQLVG